MNKELEPTLEKEFVAKTRCCLKCREAFESSWAGERVCRRCKSNDSWRTGTVGISEYPVSRRR
jgi:hypothetical protein